MGRATNRQRTAPLLRDLTGPCALLLLVLLTAAAPSPAAAWPAWLSGGGSNGGSSSSQGPVTTDPASGAAGSQGGSPGGVNPLNPLLWDVLDPGTGAPPRNQHQLDTSDGEWEAWHQGPARMADTGWGVAVRCCCFCCEAPLLLFKG
jgi:hypothetical protein